jgi:hypothetical protein
VDCQGRWTSFEMEGGFEAQSLAVKDIGVRLVEGFKRCTSLGWLVRSVPDKANEG